MENLTENNYISHQVSDLVKPGKVQVKIPSKYVSSQTFLTFNRSTAPYQDNPKLEIIFPQNQETFWSKEKKLVHSRTLLSKKDDPWFNTLIKMGDCKDKIETFSP